MDTTLATVTIISLLLAWAMAIVMWQRLRAERRRSDARLAEMAELARPDGRGGRPADAELLSRPLLTEVAGPGEGPMELRERSWQVETPPAMAGRPSPRGRRAPVAPRLPFAAPDGRRWAGDDDDARVAGHAWERAGRRGAADAAPGGSAAGGRSARRRAGLGSALPSPTRWGHGLAAVAVATILVAGVYLAERTPLSRVGAYLAERTPLSRVGVYLAGRTPLPRAGADLPVELLFLDHRRQGDYLAVSGSLRNPPGGRERSKLSVAATVFDRDGAIIGTGQTPLPPGALPPGAETTFTISLPGADRINRYRVSFMEDESRLPHVDRRGPAPAALAETGARP